MDTVQSVLHWVGQVREVKGRFSGLHSDSSTGVCFPFSVIEIIADMHVDRFFKFLRDENYYSSYISTDFYIHKCIDLKIDKRIMVKLFLRVNACQFKCYVY